MAQITWRNINAPNFSKVSDILGEAGNSLQRALGGVKGIAADAEARDKTQTAKNTDAFLNQLQKENNSPEALQAAIANGGVDKLAAQYGNLDSSRTNVAALNSLVQNLQGQTLQQNNYERSLFETNARPLDDEFAALLGANDVAGAREFLNNNDALNEAQKQSQVSSLERTLAGDKRSAADRARSIRRQNEQDAFQADERKRIADERRRTEQERIIAEKNKNNTNSALQDAFSALIEKENTPNQVKRNLMENLLDADIPFNQAINTLNNADQAFLSSTDDSAITKRDKAVVQASIMERGRTNSFFQDDLDKRPAEAKIADVVDTNRSAIEKFFPGDQQRTLQFIRKAMTTGVDFAGDNVRLTPDMMSNLLSQAHGSGWDSLIGNSDTPEEVFNEIMKNNPEVFLAPRREYDILRQQLLDAQ